MASLLSTEQIRAIVLEILNKCGTGQLTGLANDASRRAEELGLVEEGKSAGVAGNARAFNPQNSRQFIAQVQNVIWDLIIEGVIRPGMNDGMNPDLSHFHVTEWGKEALAKGTHTPYDPDGYLTRLQADLPTINPIIITYLRPWLGFAQ
jgi:hypothetical protein